MEDIPGKANTLCKEERLCGKSAVGHLMAGGTWGTAYPLRYCWVAGNGLGYNRIMTTAPKKYFKRAVKRNLLKRRLRESYRVRKDIIPAEAGVDIMFFYSCPEIKDSAEIAAAVEEALRRVGEAVK